MATIDYFLFPLSPYTYLAGDGLEQVAARQGADIVYRPFNLMQVFAQTGGTPVGERHPSRQAYRLADLARVADYAGLPINVKPAHWPTNPVPASAAIIAAQAAGGDVGALVRAILRKCWADEADIAEDAVIAEALTEAGFDPALASSGLLSGAEAFERNTQAALDAGVFGAPAYVVGDAHFWGQDRLPHLEQFLKGG